MKKKKNSPRLRKSRSLPEPEHGDWRLPLVRPEEAVHLHNPPLSVWKRMQLRVEYLQAMPGAALSGDGLPHAEDEEPSVIPISGWPRILRLLISLFLLLPLSIVMVFALMRQLYHAGPRVSDLGFWLSEPVWFTLLGAGTFIALTLSRFAEPVLIYIYVLGHELTHALAAKLCFGRVQAFRIDFDGGYVETDTDNLFIALSPYFVPLWMLVWMLTLWLGNLLFPFEQYLPWFCAGFGFWWFFHLHWTIWVIPREQPDMLENGILLSMLVILLMNILILLVILCCFDVITPLGYAQDFVDAARRIYESGQALMQMLGK